MRRFFMRLLRRLRKANRVVTLLLYTAFGLLTFLVSLTLSLPVDKIKDRIERELSQEPGPPQAANGSFGIGSGMDVSIGELDLHVLGPGVSASDVRLRPRKPLSSVPSPDAAKNLRPIVIDRIDARVRPLDAAFGTKSGTLTVEAFGGELKSALSMGDDGILVDADLHDMMLARLSSLAQLLPLPMAGTLGLSLHFNGPNQKPTTPTRGPAPAVPLPPRLDLQRSTGNLELKLVAGQIGDGKAKLVVPGDPFLSQGLTFPRLRLGDVVGKVTIERGRASIVDLHAKSPDVEVWIDGYLDLRDPLILSDAHLYVRFKPSPQFVSKEPTLELVVNSQSQGKRTDGAIGFAITGSLSNPRARPSKEPPDGVALRAGTLGQVSSGAQPSLQPKAPPLQLPTPPPPSTLVQPATAPPMPPPPAPSSSDTVSPPAAPAPSPPSPPQQVQVSPPNPMASASPPGVVHAPPVSAQQVPPPQGEAPSHPSSEAPSHPSSEAPHQQVPAQ